MKQLQKMYLVYPHTYNTHISSKQTSSKSKTNSKEKHKNKYHVKLKSKESKNVGPWIKIFQKMLKNKSRIKSKNHKHELWESFLSQIEKQQQKNPIDIKTNPPKFFTDAGTQTTNIDLNSRKFSKNTGIQAIDIGVKNARVPPTQKFQISNKSSTIDEDDTLTPDNTSDTNDVYESADEIQEEEDPMSYNLRPRPLPLQKGKGIEDWITFL